jgi:Pectate lyase superfamily protein
VPSSEREITIMRNSWKSQYVGLWLLLLFTAVFAVGCSNGGGGTPPGVLNAQSISTASNNSLADKPGQVFNIRDYGASGDGETNDSPAFQAAYNAAVAAGGGMVFIPPSSNCYLLSTPINMTEDNHTVAIEDDSMSTGATGYGSVGSICADTGGVLFDLTNSANKTFHNLTVTAQTGVTHPSLIGILLARDSNGNSGGSDYVVDCKFAMPLHTSGTIYSFGVYLYGSEITFMTRDVFVADYPLVVSGTNDFNVSSPFASIGTGPQSETDAAFTDMELDTSGFGNAIYVDGVSDMTFTGHSWNFNAASPYPSTLQQYALMFKGSNLSISLKWRQEGFPGFLSTQFTLGNSQIYGTDAPFPNASGLSSVHAVEFTDGSANIVHDDFAILDEYPFATTNFFYDATQSAVPGVAILSDINFSCGKQQNCVNIPVGNYNPGYPTGWHDLRWSGEANNLSPLVITGPGSGAPVTGTFTVPGSPIAPYGCTSLQPVPAAGGQSASILMSPQEFSNLLVTGKASGGYLTPMLCNPTSGAIAPPAYTVGWTVQQ